MDSLNYRYGPPCPGLLCPAGRPPLKRPYDHFRSGLPAARLRGWFAGLRVVPPPDRELDLVRLACALQLVPRSRHEDGHEDALVRPERSLT
jgi:hypothetical protein